MSSSELTLGKVVQRFLLYAGVALAVLAVFAAAIVLSKGTVGRLSGAWMGLVVFTFCLFWVIVRQWRAYWHHLGLWLAIAGLLALHLPAFIFVLRVYPQWREIWFVPVVIVEGDGILRTWGGVITRFVDLPTTCRPRSSTRGYRG
jgi:hypothetical protein